MNREQIILYFESVSELFSSLGRSADVQCDSWENLFDRLGRDPSLWDDGDLPILLALVHPHCYRDRREVDIGQHLSPPHSKRSFPRDRFRAEACGIEILIPGCSCPFWRGEVLFSDHLWPHSLGGATTDENLLHLCEECNRHKSSSPMLFPGKSVPEWLKSRVLQIHKLKSRRW